MKLKRRRQAREFETIITLIDVVFFLLVFFMLIGRMDATAPFDVTPPVARTGHDMPTGGITVSVSPTGDLAMNGNAIAWSELALQLGRVAPANDRLRINAHHAALTRDILPLISLGETAGFDEVILVVSPPNSQGLP